MKNLKILREARGLSQQKLADVFSISQQSIYKYENGLAEPDIDTLIGMADFFHTSIDHLVGRVENIQPIDVQPLTPTESHHLYMYNRLSDSLKKSMDAVFEEISQ